MKLYKTIFIFMLLLAGCAITEKQSAEKLAASHGYVFVHFPRDTAEITVKDTASNKSYTLENSRKESVAGLWLPPGSYKLESAAYSRSILSSGRVKLQGYPTFEIKQNRVTNLGSLINFSVKANLEVWLPKSDANTAIALQHKMQELTQYLGQEEVLSWDVTQVPEPGKFSKNFSGDGIIVGILSSYAESQNAIRLDEQLLAEKDIDKFFELAKKLLPPLPSQEMVTDNAGNLYAGAELGQIKKRTSSGKWHTINTGGLGNINKVYWYNNTLFAADSANSLLYSQDNGENWQKIYQLNAQEEIADIDAIEGKLYFVGTIRTKENIAFPEKGINYTVNVYQANLEKTDQIEKIHTFSQAEGWDVPKASIYNGKYYLGLGYKNLIVMDIASQTWRTLVLPDEFTSFNISPTGVVTLIRTMGLYSDVFVSLDLGQHWQEVDAPSFVQDVEFQSLEDGIAIKIEMNAFSTTGIVQTYDSKKDKWFDIAEAPEECRYLLKGNQGPLAYCVTSLSTVLSFDKDWKAEFYN